MERTRMKRIALVAGLLAAGYIAGAVTTPSVHAYTQDKTRLLNKITTELSGIRSALDSISRKID